MVSEFKAFFIAKLKSPFFFHFVIDCDITEKSYLPVKDPWKITFRYLHVIRDILGNTIVRYVIFSLTALIR